MLKNLKILACAGIAFAGIARADVDFGLLYSDYKLTLAPGHRAEAAGPLFYSQHSQQIGAEHQLGFPPLLTLARDPDLQLTEFDLGYPAISYRRYGAEYRFQIFQFLSWAGGSSQKEDLTRRFTLFPVYFRQRNAIDPSQNYTAFVPFYGEIKHRFSRDDMRFTMFPLYLFTRKKDVLTYNYLYPIYHERYGQRLYGRQIWPFYGFEAKGVTYHTNILDEVEPIGGHDHFFAMFPIYTHNWDGLGTTNPAELFGVIPFYVHQHSPLRDSVSYGWPLGYNIVNDQEKKYQERDFLWPLFVTAWGEGKTEKRRFPFYSHARNQDIEDDWYMWPVYKVNIMHVPPVERQRTRICFFLYSDTMEKDTNNLSTMHRVEAWPLYQSRHEMNGDRRIQVLALLESLFPNSKSIAREYAPVYSLWVWERNAKTGETSQSLLWNLYHRQRREDYKKISCLFGLFQYESDFESRSWRVCYFPIGKKKPGAAAPTSH